MSVTIKVVRAWGLLDLDLKIQIQTKMLLEGNNEKKFKKDAPTRDRTEDLSVNSRTLYQLSHGGGLW